jgi:hypothetical protein
VPPDLSGKDLPLEELLGTFRVVPHVATQAGADALAPPIGWDRKRAERRAGLRTFPHVAVTRCGFVQATERLPATSPEATSRIVEGLITGIRRLRDISSSFRVSVVFRPFPPT